MGDLVVVFCGWGRGIIVDFGSLWDVGVLGVNVPLADHQRKYPDYAPRRRSNSAS